MANYGLKISTPGNDVKNAADLDLVYTTKYPGWKIVNQGTASHTGTGSFATVSLVSGSSVNGFGLVWVENSTSDAGKKYNVPCFVPGAINGAHQISKSNGLDLYISAPNGDNINIYYYWLYRS